MAPKIFGDNRNRNSPQTCTTGHRKKHGRPYIHPSISNSPSACILTQISTIINRLFVVGIFYNSKTGRFPKSIDKGSSSPHSHRLYDNRPKFEASVFLQLCTEINLLNSYLFRIGAVETDQCACMKGRASFSLVMPVGGKTPSRYHAHRKARE